MSEHALISPSSAQRILACPGSLLASKGIPSTTSIYAREGSGAHMLASTAWDENRPAEAYIGRMFYPDPSEDGVEVDEDMAYHVQRYLDTIGEYSGGNTEELAEVDAHSDTFVEQKLDTSHPVGIQNQFGTADFIILNYDTDELQVHDLKYGKGVCVDADENKQLMLYAAAALHKYSCIHDFKDIRMVIHQPRLNHLSEWCISAKELAERIGKMRPGFMLAYKLYNKTIEFDPDKHLVPSTTPGKMHCQFCPALPSVADLPTCSAVEAIAHKTAIDWFDDLDAPASMRELPDGKKLAECKALTPLLELWCKTVNTKVHTELTEGREVPGNKLVQGKKGNRAWDKDNITTVTQLAEEYYGDDAYSKKILSPSQAEKKAKKLGVTDIWDALKSFVTQPDGKPQVVAESDPRPALVIQPVEDQFEDLT